MQKTGAERMNRGLRRVRRAAGAEFPDGYDVKDVTLAFPANFFNFFWCKP
jgi:hypothetical protein